MRELATCLRTLIGVVPVGLEQLGRAAVGSPSQWAWLPPAIPWLVAAAAGLAVGGAFLTLAETARDYPPAAAVAGALAGGGVVFGLGSLVQGRRSLGLLVNMILFIGGAVAGGAIAALATDLIVDAPVAAAAVVGLLVGGVVLGWRLQIAHSAQAAATTIGFVPGVTWLLLILALLPALQAGAEVTITRSTVSQFVERQVGFSSSLIDIHGLALLSPFRAEPPFDPEAGPAQGEYRWLAVRDELSDRGVALLRTSLDLPALQRREIVARVRDDIDPVAALDALRERGVSVPEDVSSVVLQGLGSDDAAAAAGVRSIGSLNELAGVEPGSLVRLTLDFPGDGVASCALADACQARRLGRGIGPWLHLAQGPDTGTRVIVQLGYPPSVAPVRIFGRQESDPAAVARFLDGPQVRLLLGWAQVLRAAIVEHDPTLPVDRLWVGPILFMALALLLWIGRRVVYPVFSSTPLAGGSWAHGTAESQPIRASARGRISVPGRSPLTLDDALVSLSRAGPDTQLVVDEEGRRQEVTVPRALGALSGMEAGDLRYVGSRRPVLRVGWYGSQVQLVFRSVEERDAAAAMLSGLA